MRDMTTRELSHPLIRKSIGIDIDVCGDVDPESIIILGKVSRALGKTIYSFPS